MAGDAARHGPVATPTPWALIGRQIAPAKKGGNKYRRSVGDQHHDEGGRSDTQTVPLRDAGGLIRSIPMNFDSKAHITISPMHCGAGASADRLLIKWLRCQPRTTGNEFHGASRADGATFPSSSSKWNHVGNAPAYAANFRCRTPSSSRRTSGYGTRHMVRYVSRKTSHSIAVSSDSRDYRANRKECCGVRRDFRPMRASQFGWWLNSAASKSRSGPLGPQVMRRS